MDILLFVIYLFIVEEERILQDLPDEDLPFFLRIEKSSLSEELRKDFPRLCDAFREARLSPKFELKVNWRESHVLLQKETFKLLV